MELSLETVKAYLEAMGHKIEFLPTTVSHEIQLFASEVSIKSNMTKTAVLNAIGHGEQLTESAVAYIESVLGIKSANPIQPPAPVPAPSTDPVSQPVVTQPVVTEAPLVTQPVVTEAPLVQPATPVVTESTSAEENIDAEPASGSEEQEAS